MFERSLEDSLQQPEALQRRQSASLPPNDFYWSYTGGTTNTTIRQCAPLGITWGGGAGSTNQLDGPFYLVAIPVGGTPTQIPLGNGRSASFTLPFSQGTQFTMAVVDSQGHQGGFVGLLNIVAGDTNSCVVPPNSPLRLAINTTNVPVCNVLGAQVSGGTPPYTVTIVPAGSIASTTNTTLNANNNYFGYVAADNSGTQLLVAARDSVGNWAPTSSIVFVTGDNAGLPSCGGVANFQSNGPPSNNAGSATISASPTAPGGGSAPSGAPSGPATGAGSAGNNAGSSSSSSGGSSTNVGAIVGGVIGGIAGLALLLLLGFCLYRRRQRRSPAGQTSAYRARPSIEPEMGEFGAADHAHVTPFDLSESSAGSPYLAPVALGSARAESSTGGTQGHQHDLPGEGNFRLANPDHADGYAAAPAVQKTASGPGDAPGSGSVFQHRDGGRYIPEHGELPNELAPAYTDLLSRGPSLRR